MSVPTTPANGLTPLQQAALALKEMRLRIDRLEAARREPIAIVGLSCHFPGAENPEAFWRLLEDGVEAVGEVPPDRWDAAALFDPDPAREGRIATTRLGALGPPELFDAAFFGIAPREAMSLDPQQRLLLEVAWEALEDAAIAPDRLAGAAAGVFAAAFGTDYFELLARGGRAGVDPYFASGTVHSMASGRIAYVLGLNGPAITVDTACSSSLVAVHLAVRALRHGDCDLALAGGASRILLPTYGLTFSRARMLAADGRCKAFDAAADGYVRAEGCGVLVLKRLSRAKADGDRVLAVIRGSALNQDGASSGLTVPNGPAQEAVIRMALADAGLGPEAVGYVEAHGTGTALGDPIEMGALGAVFAPGRSAARPLWVGSVKTNIGHAEAAAGVAGLIKAVLALRAGRIPPHLHFRSPSPHVDWRDGALAVPTASVPFPTVAGRRVAGVSSFGLSGTNAHVVVEAAAERPAASVEDGRSRLLVLSARSEAALAALAARWAACLAQGGVAWADACRTAALGRAWLPWRLALVARSSAEAAGQLRAGGPAVARGRAGRGKLAFLLARAPSQRPSAEDETALVMRWREWGIEPERTLAIGDPDEAAGTVAPALVEAGIDVCLAFGAGLDAIRFDGVTTVPAPDGSAHDRAAMLDALARLWVAGADFRPMAVNGPGRQVTLPTYPWQRRRFWVDEKRERPPPALADHTALTPRRLPSPLPQAQFVLELDRSRPSFLAEHGVGDRCVAPLALLLTALCQVADGLCLASPAIAGLTIDAPVDLAEVGTRTLQFAAAPDNGTGRAVEIFSRAADAAEDSAWQWHGSGFLVPDAAPSRPDPTAAPSFDGEPEAGKAFYAALAGIGYAFGPTFRRVRRLWRQGDAVLAEIDARIAGESGAPHPAVLDACLQPAFRLAPDPSAVWVPTAIGRFRRGAIGGASAPVLSSLLRRVERRGDAITVDVVVRDPAGEPVFVIDGLELKRLDARPVADSDRLFFEASWEPQPPPPVGSFAAGTVEAAAQRAGITMRAVFRSDAAAAYAQALIGLERLSQAYVAAALRALGAEGLGTDPLPARTIAMSLGVASRYRRLLDRLLLMLAATGSARRDELGWRIGPLTFAAPDRLQADLARTHPEAAAELILLARCGRALASVLRGETDPLDLLFPRRDPTDAERLYTTSPWSTAMHDVLVRAVEQVLARLPDGRRLRVLEIGAGTGATTARILPVLPAGRTEYLFTDISPLFTIRAAERFADTRGLRAQPLDIERDPAEQGLVGRQFDLVVAANVLHATRDLRASLRHVRGLMAPGGVLVLLEGTGPLAWGDLTFGLTEGWWRFADRDIRPDHPMASLAVWRRVLTESGFVAVGVLDPAEEINGARFAQAVILAQAADTPASGRWRVLGDDPALRAAAERCLEEASLAPAADARERPAGLVLLACGTDAPDESRLPQAVAARTEAALSALRTAADGGLPLWLVTRGAVALDGDGGLDGLAGAALPALARTAALELPDFRCRCLDLDPAAAPDDFTPLAVEIASEDGETQVAWRGGVRHALRVRPAIVPAPLEPPFRLELAEPGRMESLRPVPLDRRPPEPGEIELAIHATGLNFRDVLVGLNLYPGDAGPLGYEAAGVITAVGEGVADLRLGDTVAAIVRGALASHATVARDFVLKLPPDSDPAVAAGLPVAYVTALCALEDVARVRPGERVLVHAAAGGTGMALVRLGRLLGAEVLGTASRSKQWRLRVEGVEHVFDSRSPDFADGVLAATGGHGVDVVVNVLAGDAFIAAGLRSLAQGGRFVELGRRGIWSIERVGAVRPDVAYTTIDLLRTVMTTPAVIRRLLDRLGALLEAGALRPLPVTAFPAEQAAAALRYMEQARQTGKVVVTRSPETVVRPSGTWLVTGGLGGLGRAVGAWLRESGAERVVLAGRRLRTPPAGCEARTLDVTDAAAVEALLRELAADGPPLTGIVHAAGVLDDRPIGDLDPASLERVLAPKVLGAWHLHRLTRMLAPGLRSFVLFSSATGLLGNPGQANHAAANGFLDALARHRRARGLPAIAIGWGVWGEVGAAAEATVQERLARRGWGTLSNSEGLAGLAEALRRGSPYLAVAAIERGTFTVGGSSPVENASRDEPLPFDPASGTAEDASPQARRERLLIRVSETLGQVLGLRAEDIDPRQRFFEAGMDSLTSVEFRRRLERGLGVALPATIALDHPTVEAVVTFLLAAERKADGDEPQRAEAPTAYDDIPDEAVAAMLGERLDHLEGGMA
jgi:acyl transferase domain-containing protein/NADPH:quinone reductase-like Zn-dependent oxidoreductase/acyl carrier protein